MNATFRVEGKAPELWDRGDAARRSRLRIASLSGRTTVPLHLDPYGTTFVVFREPAATATLELARSKGDGDRGLDDALNQRLDRQLRAETEGAPETAQFDRLISWSESAGRRA